MTAGGPLGVLVASRPSHRLLLDALDPRAASASSPRNHLRPCLTQEAVRDRRRSRSGRRGADGRARARARAGDRGRDRRRAAAGPDHPRHPRVRADARVGARRRASRRPAATPSSAASCRRRPPRSSCRRHGFDLGAVVSASHNPWRDNGIKFFGRDGRKLDDEAEAADRGPRRRPARPTAPHVGPDPQARGRARRLPARARPSASSLDLSGRKIVLDCANGATYRAAPARLRAPRRRAR